MTESTKPIAISPNQPVKTVTFVIDGRSVTVPKGTTVLQAALAMGIDIPFFCWHPKLKPVGACRMCYVEIEKFPKLQVSCATEASDGMIVNTDSNMVKQGRKAVLEFTLTNHPLDCPTCDKGGECDLQNLTFGHGYDDSRFDFSKRRHVEDEVRSTFDDVRIGPEIVLNRNRCILCYKCVRANKEAFGEYDLGAYERGNHTEINAAPGEQVNNPFSGNLVEICPVGALTNTDWRYKVRVWLTKTVSSLDIFTPSGLNTTVYKDSHKNHMYRTTSRRNDDIDDGWIPDVTRYGYQVVESKDRIKTPLIKRNGTLAPASWDEALALIAKKFKEIQDTKGNICIGGLVSPSLDNASLYGFNKFMRTVIGTNAVDFRTEYRNLPTTADSPFGILSSQSFSIKEIDTSDLIVTFGSDTVREHPNEYLRMRKAYQFNNAKVVTCNAYAVKSSDIASFELVYKPGTEELFIAGVCYAAVEEKLASGEAANGLKGKFPVDTLADCSKATGITSVDFKSLARSLNDARKITFFVGRQITESRDRDSIAAALLNLNMLLGISAKGQFAAPANAANSIGAEQLGAMPNIPIELQKQLVSFCGKYPDTAPKNTDQMLDQMRQGELNGMFILGLNPVMLSPEREYVAESLKKLNFLVVADLFETATTALADVVLPLSSWAEYTGSYTNLEGTVQRAEAVLRPLHESRPGFEIMSLLAEKVGVKLFNSEATRDREMDQLLLRNRALPLPQGLLEVRTTADAEDREFPLILIVGDDAHHRGHWTEKAASLVNFVGEAYVELSPETAERHDIKEGALVKVESRMGKVTARAILSPHIDNDVVFMPRNFSAVSVNALQSRKDRLDRVKISVVKG